MLFRIYCWIKYRAHCFKLKGYKNPNVAVAIVGHL